MATANQVNQCWKDLEKVGVASKTVPVTYMNSSAAIKSFTGEHGGTICTSSNAQKTLEWAFAKAEKVLGWKPERDIENMVSDAWEAISADAR